ncbi:MAG: c-type cytochrome [Candidatus Binatia bacterium]
MTHLRAALAACLACLLLPDAASAGATTLRFLRDGQLVKEVELETLKKKCRIAAVVIEDPYYKKRKSFLAVPLKQALSLGFGAESAALAREEFFFQALDGYVKPAAGSRVVEDGGYLAFADADRSRDGVPGWEPIDRRQVDPGPYYVVWSKPNQTDANGYPWPFQLAAVEIVHFEKKYPFTLPRNAADDSAAWHGFQIFRAQCISCHSINGQGGKIGPDLNVPMSIVEYRPIAQVKAYIRDPQTFRYSSMPAHRGLTDEQLDQLIAYFSTMKSLKRDPGATE